MPIINIVLDVLYRRNMLLDMLRSDEIVNDPTLPTDLPRSLPVTRLHLFRGSGVMASHNSASQYISMQTNPWRLEQRRRGHEVSEQNCFFRHSRGDKHSDALSFIHRADLPNSPIEVT